MAKNIALDMEFLTSGMAQAIGKARVVTNDLSEGYFAVKRNDEAGKLWQKCCSTTTTALCLGPTLLGII